MNEDEFWLEEIRKIYIEKMAHELNLERWIGYERQMRSSKVFQLEQ